MVKRVLVIAGAALGVVLVAVLLFGNSGKSDPVTFTEGGVDVKVEFLDTGLVGDRVKVTLKPEAIDGYMAAAVTLEVSGDLAPIAPVDLPHALTKKDVPVPVFAAGAARVEVKVKRASDKPGKATVKVGYQACDKTGCKPAVVGKTVTLTLK
ncbi:hypothetical protein Lfu02_52420 [Longispora fulva]|uniref:Thiol:disulfide interchange protein n=1 Tax=Longispora fulva TaxID=619741 RepID=A0A8J7GXF8_9ACTN|nr:hypothetical protein [Longispora fulva]MBG6140864.1 thiol:disulfide interchange protein [Longispora fulva]GIG60870.1 hypothetical protein Lfu02_52420 [Longispora fulva]